MQQYEDLPLLMTYEQVSKVLAISRSYVVKLVKKGDLTVVRIGRSVRVRREDLIAFIEQNVTEGV